MTSRRGDLQALDTTPEALAIQTDVFRRMGATGLGRTNIR